MKNNVFNLPEVSPMTTQCPLSRAIRCLVLFALCAFPFVFAQAQSATATLSGTVEDEQGAVIPGAAITVLNPSTALQRQATTNDQGSFTVTLLQPGTYSVTVRRDGFAPIEVKNVVLNVGDQKALRIQLKAGDVNATVQVQSEVPLINESPAVATVIDRQFVGNLPLNGRSFQSLILLTPGIVQTTSDVNHPGEFSVNGQRQNANYFTVDGVSANTGVGTSGAVADLSVLGGSVPATTALGTTSSLVSVDALEEFKIQTSTYSAELGRQPGGQVQLVTRAGTNQFHGSAFDYLRNEIFDANNWFTNSRRLTAQQIAQGITKQPRQPLRQNQFGGTFSGPVMLPRFGEGDKPYWSGRNKTFFFFSYEGQRLLIPVVSTGNFVPSLRLRQAAAPVVRAFLNAFPLPTGPETLNFGVPSGQAPFAASYSNPSAVDAYSIRIDHAVTGNLTLFGRYSQTPSSSLTRAQNQLSGDILKNRVLTLGATLSLSPQLHNEIRFNITNNRGRNGISMDDFGGAVPISRSQLLTGYSGSHSPVRGFVGFFLPSVLFPGLSLGDAIDSNSRQMNLVDNVSLVRGRHELKFGVDWRRLSPTYAPIDYGQNIFFYDEQTVISGIADEVDIFSTKKIRPIYDNLSAYLHDRWQVSPRLMLDLGVRWELNPVPHDSNGFKPVLLTGVTASNVSNAALAPADTPIYKTSYTAFAPRVGAAYQLNRKSGRETVLRGGIGVYYDLGSGPAGFVFNSNAFGVTALNVLSNVQLPLTAAQAAPPVFQTTLTLPISLSFFAVNPDLKLPYSLHWNIGLEQALGANQAISVAYVGSASRRLLTTTALNQRPRSPVTGAQLPRPNPSFGNINYSRNGPTSDYHSLQAQYRQRFSGGLQTLASYTWSHAIDEVSNEIDTSTFDRGNADFDIRHNFTAALTYDLPKLRGSGFVKALANGWSVSSTFYARSGQPLNMTAGSMVRPDGSFVTVRADLVGGQPLWIKDATVPGGQRLNPAAFSLPPRVPGQSNIATRQGTLARNAIHAPGIYQLNLGLQRHIHLTELLNLQVGAEAFNVLNRPMFGGYRTSIIGTGNLLGVPTKMLSNGFGGSAGSGLNSLYQIGGPRSMQFSLRLSF